MKRPQGVYEDKQRGTWYWMADAPGPDGKKRKVKKRGFATAEEARDDRDKFRARVRDGHVPVPANDTVAAFATAWIAALPAEEVEPATVRNYSECVNRLLPTIGTVKLQELTALDLDRAYAALRELGRSARTVRASHVAVKKMLAEAVRIKKVSANVAAAARPPRSKSTAAKRFPTWTYEQLGRFLETVADHQHADLWRIAGWTGMRQGEIVALRWDDVDLDVGTIKVSRAIGRGADGYYEKEPKSAAGRRTIELDDQLVAVFRRHRQGQLEQRLALGPGWRETDLVFCALDGSRLDPNGVSKAWTALVRLHAPSLGVPAIRFHDLRHSHCTQLLDAEVRVDIVTERLGHSSIAFTLQQYVHRYAGDQRSGLARLRATAT